MTGTMSVMDTNRTETAAEAVLQARLAAGLSKESVARKAEVSSITYKRVEDGKAVQDASLARVFMALDLKWDGNDVVRIEYVPSKTSGVGVPVGAGVDADVLAELAELEPDKVQRVKDFIRGIKAGE